MKLIQRPSKLNRFTGLPSLFTYLETGKLALSNPRNWEDRNDTELLDLYRQQKGLKTLGALCFTSVSETIHHWKAFAPGPSGCCIEFSYQKFRKALRPIPTGFRFGKVRYKKIKEVEAKRPSIDEFPFTKRVPFSVEGEYRLLFGGPDDLVPPGLEIGFDAVNRITLSYELSEPAYEGLQTWIVWRRPELAGKINQSTLLRNHHWIGAFSGTA